MVHTETIESDFKHKIETIESDFKHTYYYDDKDTHIISALCHTCNYRQQTKSHINMIYHRT